MRNYDDYYVYYDDGPFDYADRHAEDLSEVTYHPEYFKGVVVLPTRLGPAWISSSLQVLDELARKDPWIAQDYAYVDESQGVFLYDRRWLSPFARLQGVDAAVTVLKLAISDGMTSGHIRHAVIEASRMRSHVEGLTMPSERRMCVPAAAIRNRPMLLNGARWPVLEEGKEIQVE